MKTLQDKINLLSTLVATYTLHLKHHDRSEVKVNGDMIEVTYYNTKGKWWSFEKIEFPITHIDRRLEHYKNKLDRIMMCA